MRIRTLWPAALITLIIGAAALPAAEEVVEIRLRGRFFPEPATVRVTVAVKPAPENRALVIEADSQRLFRSSEVELEGAQEQRLHTVEFKNLPAGEYTLRAEVRSGDGVRGVAEEYVTVGDPRER